MKLKLSDVDARLRARIEAQLAAEDAALVGARPAQSAKPDRRTAGEDCRVESAARRVGFCISLIQHRRRLLDEHDSLRFAVKPLVDAITDWLGFQHDNDPRLRWEYAQIQTRATEGVVVKIEPINDPVTPNSAGELPGAK